METDSEIQRSADIPNTKALALKQKPTEMQKQKRRFETRAQSLMRKGAELAILTGADVRILIAVPGLARKYRVFYSELDDFGQPVTTVLKFKVLEDEIDGGIRGPRHFLTADKFENTEGHKQKLRDDNEIELDMANPEIQHLSPGGDETADSLPPEPNDIASTIEKHQQPTHIESQSATDNGEVCGFEIEADLPILRLDLEVESLLSEVSFRGNAIVD